MWEAAVRAGPCCRYVPPDDYYRKRFEVLAGTGLAVRGPTIPEGQVTRLLLIPPLHQP